jgi:alpha-D-ribose 1-methylphosphonate 5-phosphate C-P lyase
MIFKNITKGFYLKFRDKVMGKEMYSKVYTIRELDKMKSLKFCDHKFSMKRTNNILKIAHSTPI